MGELDLLRVDHIGSFRRPEPLLDMHTRFDDGDATPEELAALEDELIREVIAHQERTGFPIVTDGEFRRRNFQDSFGAAVSGYDTPESREEYQRWQEGKPLPAAAARRVRATGRRAARRHAASGDGAPRADAQPPAGGVPVRRERRPHARQGDAHRPRPRRAALRLAGVGRAFTRGWTTSGSTSPRYSTRWCARSSTRAAPMSTSTRRATRPT